MIGLLVKEEKIIYFNFSVKLIYKLQRNNDISLSCLEVNYVFFWIVFLINKFKVVIGGGC